MLFPGRNAAVFPEVMRHTGQGNRLRGLGKGREGPVREKIHVQSGPVSHDRHACRGSFKSRQPGAGSRLRDPQNIKKRKNFVKIFPKRQKTHDAFALVLARKVRDVVPLTLGQRVQMAGRGVFKIRIQEQKPHLRVHPHDGID